MQAIISDIHGNVEALSAVLADIRTQSIGEILCLGDIIGYGPNPKECVDLARRFRVTVLGNHDEAALFQSMVLNPNFTLKTQLRREETEGVRRIMITVSGEWSEQRATKARKAVGYVFAP